MYMHVPVKTLFEVSNLLSTDVEKRLVDLEANGLYNFKLGAWERVDSYGLSKAPKLSTVIGNELVNYVMKQFPGEHLFGWSLSMLPPGQQVLEHTDRMMFHRLARRVIVPVGPTKDVLNWSYASDKKTKRYYLLETGAAYQLNTAITHGLSNNGSLPRRAVYFDVIDERLYQKFISHPDIMCVILKQNTGAVHVL